MKLRNEKVNDVTSELLKLTDFFGACRDHSWNVAKKYVNKVYHLGCDDLMEVTNSMIEGRECNILYMLPHIYKGDWKNLKKLPYIEELAKRTDLKAYKNELAKLIDATKFVYRDEVNIIGPVKLVDRKTGYKYNLLFVQLPYVLEDCKDIVNGRSLYRTTNDSNKAMDWTKYNSVFKHYIVNTGFIPNQAVRAYFMTIALAAAVKHGMLEVVVPSSVYTWSIIERDFTPGINNKNACATINAWQNAFDYAVASCRDINTGLMDIHVADVDENSDAAVMFNYDPCVAYPDPVKFGFTKSKKTTDSISDEPKTTEPLEGAKVVVNKDTLDETIDKAAKKENLD